MQQQENRVIYGYRPHPFLERAYLICRNNGNGDITPVGDYTVLDDAEDLALSEKKLMNLVNKLNGDNNLVYLGGETKSRLLFHIKAQEEGSRHQEIIFYTYTGMGTSKENAMMRLEEIKGEKDYVTH